MLINCNKLNLSMDDSSQFKFQSEEHYNGMRFCNNCNNILIPLQPDPERQYILIYKCKNRDCQKTQIDFRDKNNPNDFLLYSKQQILRTTDIDAQFVLDSTMPRDKVQCKQCFYNTAVYCIKEDIDQKRLQKIYICARVENNIPICKNKWEEKWDEIK